MDLSREIIVANVVHCATIGRKSRRFFAKMGVCVRERRNEMKSRLQMGDCFAWTRITSHGVEDSLWLGMRKRKMKNSMLAVFDLLISELLLIG